MTIGLSHGGSNIYTSSEPTKELLLGTRDGVVILQRGEGSAGWQVTGRSLTDRFVSSIVLEPESGTVFAGAWKGSVHASVDGGRTWEQRGNGLTHDDVWSLASSRLNGKTRVYAGTGPAHLFCTEDLGQNWTEVSSMRSVPSTPDWSFFANPAHTKFISFDPHDPAIVYSCIEQGAFLRSTDAGETWVQLNDMGAFAGHTYSKETPSATFYDCHKTVIDPRNSARIFVSGGAGLYVTEDGGESWERWMAEGWAADVYPDGLVMNPQHPDIMFVSAAAHNPSRWRDDGIPGFSGSRIFRSTDGGRTWEWLRNGLPREQMRQEVGALCLEDWGASFSVFAATTGGEVFCSDDGGDHWSLIAEGLPPVSKSGHYRSLNAGTYRGLGPLEATPVAQRV